MITKHSRQRSSSFAKQGGFALIGVLLLMILISAVAVAFLYAASNETKIGGSDREDTLAYYGAEAAMEKMMVDVGLVYTAHKVPKDTDFGAAPAKCPVAGVSCIQPDPAKYPMPVIDGLTYPTYAISFPNGVDPASHLLVPGVTDTVQSGSFQGLSAQTIPLTLTVVSQRTGGAQVSMVRNVQVALIPVFQFGVFSETDLSYFPGPNFDFAGRVHTNGSLYLAAGSGNVLSFHDKITVVNNVVHSQLANGVNVTTSRTGLVLIPSQDFGCDTTLPPPAEDKTNGLCRNLSLNGAGGKVEESANSGWPAISSSVAGPPPKGGFHHFIQAKDSAGNGGSNPLNLPFVSGTVGPIEIIRRGSPTETNQDVIDSRLYNQAQIRVLLDDGDSTGACVAPLLKSPDDHQTVQLTDGVTTGITTVITTAGVKTDNGTGGSVLTKFGIADASKDAGFLPGAPHPIHPGCLRVEYRTSAGSYVGVTQEWLHLGFARGPNGTLAGPPDSEHSIKNLVNPNAILILQRDSNLTPVKTPAPNNYYPINLYDSREGERDPGSVTGTNISVGGIMNLVELDVGNLRQWLLGNTPTDISALGANDFGTGTAPAKSGTTVESTSQNGYILYFSDRRGMLPNTVTWATAIAPCTVAHPAPDTTLSGDYGYEDVVNGNGILDPGEDSNGNCHLDVYGAAQIGAGFGLTTVNDPYQVVPAAQAKARSVSAARHALRLVDGTLGNVPSVSAGIGGFTVASENPVYIQGNYNAKDQTTCTAAACFVDPTSVHSHTAVIADAVTLLSNAWDDDVGFANPGDSANRIQPTPTFYRLAIAGGKSLTFPNPIPKVEEDYGTDGGVHNFLRFLEDWGLPKNVGTSVHYRGSLVSFYFSHQASGTFKSSQEVYVPPIRDFTFDLDFKDPTKMPPGTPRFQDIVNIGYQQDFTPQ